MHKVLADAKLDPVATSSRRPVLFLHFHRAGGTSVCDWVRTTLKVPTPINNFPAGIANCNMLPGDGPHDEMAHRELGCFGVMNAALSCHERAHLALALNYSFVAVERWLDAPLPPACSHRFAHVTQLREPLARIRANQCAHTNWDVSNARLQRWVLPEPTSAAPKPVWAEGPRGVETCPIAGGSSSISNFYVRSLLGAATYRAPLRGLNGSHLAAATVVLLDGFAHVSVLEDEGKCHGHAALLGLLGRGVGRASDALPKHNSYSEAHCGPTWPPALVAALCDANALDIALYALFKQPNRPADGGCGGVAVPRPHGWATVRARVCTAGEASWLAHCRQVAGKACAERGDVAEACGFAWGIVCSA